MRTLILIAILCFIPPALSACNTVEGLGQDIESAGEKIQDL